MSIEAIAFVKARDFGKAESARLLLYTIAENTFNDTAICAVGVDQLAFETRKDERTIRRQIAMLVSERVLIVKKRYPTAGGRLPDALRLVGFRRWYGVNYGTVKQRHKARTSGGGYRAKCPEGLPDTAMSGVTGQQVSGTYKETRNTPVKRNAREGALEDFQFDLEGKAVRDRLHHKLGANVHDSWFAGMAFSPGDGGKAIAVAAKKFIRDWVQTHYEAKVIEACREVWPDVVRVEFRWDPNLHKAARAA